MKIVDPTLAPYEIDVDSSNYIVEELTDKVNKSGEVIYRNHGYFSSFESALSKIISLKLNSLPGRKRIVEYVEEYRKIKNEIKESIKF